MGNPTCGFPSFGVAEIHPFGSFLKKAAQKLFIWQSVAVFVLERATQKLFVWQSVAGFVLERATQKLFI